MIVTVHLGEPFWRQVGRRAVALTLAEGATLADACAALMQFQPALAPELENGEAKPVWFLNDEEGQPESLLADGATIHVVWPVSGG